MIFKFKNVYVDDTATVAGPYEAMGPLSNYFDKRYKKDSFEYCKKVYTSNGEDLD